MKRELKRQLEALMDETQGAYTDVIVQFKSENDKSLADLIKVAVETERNRSMLVDPEFILPPAASALDSETSRNRRKLKEHDANFMANMITASSKLLLGSVLSAAPLDGFLTDHLVQQAVSRVKSRLKSKAMQAEPLSLANIDAVRVMVGRNDLPKIIADKAEQIEGVYENAHIKAPRVVQNSTVGTTDPYLNTTWGLEYTKALSAWSTFQTRGQRADGSRVRVAVLDTGVDPDHPDIAHRLVDFAEFNRSGMIVSQGVDKARDSGSHGTHVAGTVVGGNASGSWIGMAPDAELISGLVLDGANGGSLAQVIKGIEWAVNSGAEVINLSLGGLTFDSSVGTPYQRAIVSALVKGSLVVAAIGNDGHQTTGAPGNDYFSLAVGAHDLNGRCAGFSGGRTHVLDQSNIIEQKDLPLVYTKPDVAAPGVGVKSCVPGGKWSEYNGTSMATPHVSGAAALLLAATNIHNRSERQRAFLLRDLLLGGVVDHGESGQDQRFGYGAINILKTIDAALQRGF